MVWVPGQARYRWNARPEAIREYTRLFLLEAGCALQRGGVDGWFVQATNRSPISTNGLHLLIAALRSFYTVMRRGVFDPQDQRFHPLYAFDNPMYSKVLVAWRSEHSKWIRNAGAPDYAGIRSASRADQARQPVGFFQVKRQPLEPPVARDSEPTRLAILAGVRYMIDHAPAREAVILRILLESGARVSEVLGLTAGGLRRAHNPKIGIDVAALVRNKGEHTPSENPSGAQLRRANNYGATSPASARSSIRQGRTKLEQLGDDDPIFLSRRKRQLEYSGFCIVFKRLLATCATALRAMPGEARRNADRPTNHHTAHDPPSPYHLPGQESTRVVQ